MGEPTNAGSSLLREIKKKPKMESLIEMGFPVNAAKRAWYYSDGNVEAAMNWLCGHMDDADYNTAFEPPTPQSTSSAPLKPTPEQLAQLGDEFSVFTAEMMDQIRHPDANTKIYKEECIWCCDTLYSQRGLFISLSSFHAFGARIKDEAPVQPYLNIKIERHVKPAEGGEPEPKKLAIGGEDGFDPEAKAWLEKVHYAVVIGTKSFALEKLPDSLAYVKSCCEAVINATSAEKKNEIASWQPDPPKVSIHADTLVQLDNGLKISPNSKDWKCARCDLCNNLWLNLSDGTLLCGRKNWDGSGGNGHALEHFNETKFPLCVKLGTITREGADVFSYAEDDMVTDPHLAKHLAHWGIDIASSEKTEKSMAEMELDINKAVGSEYAAIVESGCSLKGAFGPNRTGILNLGDTCYISSVLQALFALGDLRQSFGNPNIFDAATTSPVDEFRIQLSRIGSGLASGEYSTPIVAMDAEGAATVQSDEQTGISPGLFKAVVAGENADFRGNQQQDASEFMLHLFEQLEKQAKKDNKPNPAKFFEFEFEERLEVSGKCQYQNIPETMLGIPIDEDDVTNKSEVSDTTRGIVSFSTCLAKWAQSEPIANFKCPSTGALTTAQRRLRFQTFPKYLILQSRRFTIGANWTPKKLNLSVDFPDTLDLSEWKARGVQEGEQLIEASNSGGPHDQSDEQVVIDEQLVSQLSEMGYPYHASRKALYHSNQQLEASLEWLMNHIGDDDFDSPLVVKAASSAQPSFSPESIVMVTSMGFTENQAKKALSKTSGNVEAAIDWIFNNPDDSLMPMETAPAAVAEAVTDYKGSESPQYELVAFISHMGTSTACGHYVAHVKNDQAVGKDETEWIIFNDNKVAFSKAPPRDLAYLYFYKQV